MINFKNILIPIDSTNGSFSSENIANLISKLKPFHPFHDTHFEDVLVTDYRIMFDIFSYIMDNFPEGVEVDDYIHADSKQGCYNCIEGQHHDVLYQYKYNWAARKNYKRRELTIRADERTRNRKLLHDDRMMELRIGIVLLSNTITEWICYGNSGDESRVPAEEYIKKLEWASRIQKSALEGL